jgi:hypothetical protein
MTPRALTAFGCFLADSDFNWNDLREAFASMLSALTEHAGSEKKARRILLESVPADKQKPLAVLLGEIDPIKRGRGRPAGATGEKAHAKSYALYDLYCFEKAKNPRLTRQAFAENILDNVKRRKDKGSEGYFASIEAIDKSLRRAPRKLTSKDKATIDKVAKLVAGKD